MTKPLPRPNIEQLISLMGNDFMKIDGDAEGSVDRNAMTYSRRGVVREGSSGGDVGKDVEAASISVKCSDRWWIGEHPSQLRRLS